MLKALIIDDEKHCRRILDWAIQKNCPEIEIAAQCHSGTSALEAIEAHRPDLIFLDIEMRDMSGFEMLERVPKINFEIIFTTAYDQFALDAFKVSAADYLLKPIDEKDLIKAVGKVKKRREENQSTSQIEFLLQHIRKNLEEEEDTIALPSSTGLEFVEIEKIIYCQSDSNYTHLHLKGEKDMIVSRTLKDVEDLLPEGKFFRVHHSYTVNLKHIRRYLKADGGYLVMSNGDKVKVARSKKELLLEKF